MISVRNRRTEKLTRQRLKLQGQRSVSSIAVILVGCGLSLLAALYIASNVGKTTYSANREVRFEVADARGVAGGGRQELRFRGVPAGAISDVRLDSGKAVVTAKLYTSFGQLYRDARAELRPNTALEDMYINVLDRGTPAAGPLGDETLPARRTVASVQPEDVLSAFDAETRAHLSVVLDQLGGSLEDRGRSLRATLARLVPFLTQVDQLSGQLAVREDLTRRLIHNTGLLTTELGHRDRTLRRLVLNAGDTLRAVQSGSGDLDATLAALPGALGAVDRSFATVRDVLPDVDTALADLRPVAERLPDALTTTRRLVGEARPAINALRAPVAALQPLSRSLPGTAASLRTLLAGLAPQMPALQRVAKRVAGCSAALQGFFQWTPSVTKWGDANGPAVRGSFAFGADSAQNAKDPSVVALPSCAPGTAIGGVPGTGGDLRKGG